MCSSHKRDPNPSGRAGSGHTEVMDLLEASLVSNSNREELNIGYLLSFQSLVFSSPAISLPRSTRSIIRHLTFALDALRHIRVLAVRIGWWRVSGYFMICGKQVLSAHCLTCSIFSRQDNGSTTWLAVSMDVSLLCGLCWCVKVIWPPIIYGK